MGLFIAPPPTTLEPPAIRPTLTTPVTPVTPTAPASQPSVVTNTTNTTSDTKYELNNNGVAAPTAKATALSTQVNNYAEVSRESAGDVQTSRPSVNIYANFNGDGFNTNYTAGFNVNFPLGGAKTRRAVARIATSRALVSEAKICQSVRAQQWDREMTEAIVGKQYLVCVKPNADVSQLPQNDLSETAVAVQEARRLLIEMRAENDRLQLEIAQLKGKYYKQKTERPVPVRGLW